MVKFTKDEEQKEEYQDTLFKHSVNIKTPPYSMINF